MIETINARTSPQLEVKVSERSAAIDRRYTDMCRGRVTITRMQIVTADYVRIRQHF